MVILALSQLTGAPWGSPFPLRGHRVSELAVVSLN